MHPTRSSNALNLLPSSRRNPVLSVSNRLRHFIRREAQPRPPRSSKDRGCRRRRRTFLREIMREAVGAYQQTAVGNTRSAAERCARELVLAELLRQAEGRRPVASRLLGLI